MPRYFLGMSSFSRISFFFYCTASHAARHFRLVPQHGAARELLLLGRAG